MRTLAVRHALVVVPFCSAIIGLVVAALLVQPVYVDDSALLSGWADFEYQHTSSELIHSVDAVSAATILHPAALQLFRQLAALDLQPRSHHHLHANCTCTLISSVVRAARGDGTEAVLLAVETGEAHDMSDAAGRREVELALQLARHVRAVSWLSKDVVILFYPRCSCACIEGAGVRRQLSCLQRPVYQYLADYHLLSKLDHGSSGDAIIAAFRTRRAGLIRQLLILSQPVGDRGHQTVDVSGIPAEPVAVEVQLIGAVGHLPNLDAYAALWATASHVDVRVPLVLPATAALDGSLGWIARLELEHDGRGKTAAATRAWLPRFSLLSRLLPSTATPARPLGIIARGILGFATTLFWGVPLGDHSAGLTYGIDSLTLRLTTATAGPADDDKRMNRNDDTKEGVDSVARQRRDSTWPLTDHQLLCLLVGTVRSYSNLCEPLHHSHYTYILANSDTLLPLKVSAPLFLLPHLAYLGLRGLAHASGDTADADGAAAAGVGGPPRDETLAFAAVVCSLLTGLALAALPHAARWWRPPPWALLALLQAAWAVLAILPRLMGAVWQERAAWSSPPVPNRLASYICTLTACTLGSVTCLAIPSGLLGGPVLSCLAAIALPAPTALDSHGGSRGSSLSRVWSTLLELTLVLFISPVGLLVGATAAIGGDLAALRALSAAFNAAGEHGALPYAFVCVGCLPMSAMGAALRLERCIIARRGMEAT